MNNKRETLRKISKIGAISMALPNAWKKPLISAVVLPVHAQTSCSEIVVRRSIPSVTKLGFNFDESAGCVTQVSTSFVDPNSSDLRIELSGSVTKGHLGSLTISSSFAASIYDVFGLGQVDLYDERDILYGLFISTSGRPYYVKIRYFYLPTSRLAATVSLVPRT